MEVSTKSWHYRLIDWLEFNHPGNVCAYFWKTTWSIFLAGVCLPIIVVAGAFVVTMPFWHMFSPKYLVVAVVLVGTVEIIGLSILLYNIVGWRHEDEIYAGTRKLSEPSVAYQWAKAQHDKVCPLIRFVSE